MEEFKNIEKRIGKELVEAGFSQTTTWTRKKSTREDLINTIVECFKYLPETAIVCVEKLPDDGYEINIYKK